MRTLQALLLFLTASKNALAVDICSKPLVPSCVALPLASSRSCEAIMLSKKISPTTCFIPKATVTITQTKQSLTTTTETITATTTTKTISSPVALNVAITLSAALGMVTTTKVTFDTQTEVVTSVVAKIISKTQTVTVTETRFSSTTATAASTWSQQTCTDAANAKRAKLYKFRNIKQIDVLNIQERGPSLPDECSCYLTKSQLNNALSISTTRTVTEKITDVVTQIIGGDEPTATVTQIIRKTITSPTTISPRSTIFSTSTKIIISKVFETTTTISTSTSTKFSLKTTTETTISVAVKNQATQVINPCQPSAYGRVEIDQPVSSDGIVGNEVNLGNSEDPAQDCCNNCYNTKGCIYWSLAKSDGSCLAYTTTEKQGCSTSQCPKGFPRISVSGKSNSVNYYAGPCGSNLIPG